MMVCRWNEHREHIHGHALLAPQVMQSFYPTVGVPEVSDGSVVLAAEKTLKLMPLPAGMQLELCMPNGVSL